MTALVTQYCSLMTQYCSLMFNILIVLNRIN